MLVQKVAMVPGCFEKKSSSENKNAYNSSKEVPKDRCKDKDGYSYYHFQFLFNRLFFQKL